MIVLYYNVIPVITFNFFKKFYVFVDRCYDSRESGTYTTIINRAVYICVTLYDMLNLPGTLGVVGYH